ncbi:tripartite tricarboxylate transporter TctB family protein [Bacillus sp. HMF5848]|uniref:tripartite tricarboxylate transporter TctB family protein n=1 Tax=Bacillus sp. HMF5848 TaxID=2495421 RepID=UPI000F767842|nr:tripartite tricarboxylate transporter TctB family protein [Bacillus sp. HMF5848]RSK25712.1 tripartite tricarboxylate transporter TctB family protein [Bacillus sp. HMF5848]
MKIRTNLTSGIVFAIFSIIFILLVPSQVSIPAYDNGGPSPRIIPYIVLWGTLICSIGLIIQSLVFKKEKIIEFNFKVEKAALIILGIILLFGTIMLTFGFILAVVIVLPLMLYALGERKPFIYGFTVLGGVGVYYLFIEIFNITLPMFGG